jgi:hypothetical protein
MHSIGSFWILGEHGGRECVCNGESRVNFKNTIYTDLKYQDEMPLDYQYTLN